MDPDLGKPIFEVRSLVPIGVEESQNCGLGVVKDLHSRGSGCGFCSGEADPDHVLGGGLFSGGIECESLR